MVFSKSFIAGTKEATDWINENHLERNIISINQYASITQIGIVVITVWYKNFVEIVDKSTIDKEAAKP